MSESTIPHDRDDLLRELMMERHEPIAIIGMGVRFPGDNNTPEGLTTFLQEGGSGIRPLPTDRWDLSSFQNDDQDRARISTPAGGFLHGIDQFDPQFFNISPKEADWIDPQQRLLMETAWQALENANLDPAALRHGNGGVFIGASSIDYAFELDSMPYEQLDPALANGITIYPLSGRLSYFLGWRGPSLSTDTACASSLTAVHLAVTSLRRRECDIALAGAVNCIHHPRLLVIFTHGDVFAADGHCKTFDDAADGYARAEGCGVIALKRLSSARRDGDRILALIRGTAIGQDGESAGLTAPNGTAQEAVMRTALANAGLTPADVQYVEAHGTGTPLGDPIEMASINAVFGAAHSKADPIVVGSLKANIGHMEPVAGLGGIIKTTLQLQNRQFFPHLVNKLSERIPWDSYPVEIPRENRPWTAGTRRAMVNSFGFAGAIGVTILEQAPATRPAPQENTPSPGIFTLSAKTNRALRTQIGAYQQLLTDEPDLDIDALCAATATGRSHFSHRISGVVTGGAELSALLDRELRHLDERDATGGSDVHKVAFLFSGSGNEYIGMGAALYQRFPVFRSHVDTCDELFAPLTGRSVRDLMFGDVSDPGAFRELRYNQPIMFTFEYALAQLWMSFGIRPNVVIGHSTGEIVAAAVAEVFALPDAARLIATRGRLLEGITSHGGMTAVGADAADVAPYLEKYPNVIIGAINSPGQSVLSGALDELALVGEELRDRGWQVTPLTVPVASHSPLMKEIAGPLRAVLASIPMHEPSIALISNSTGQAARASDITDPEYWIRHICQTLDFAAGMRTIERRGRHAFIEIGPAGSLTAPAAQCIDATEHVWVTSTHAEDTDATTLRASIAELYIAGLRIAWPAIYPGPHRYIRLPNYVFDRRRYWLPNDATRHRRDGGTGTAANHPLLGTEVTEATSGGADRTFVTRLSASHPAYLADHRARGQAFVPVASYLEAILALQDAVYGETCRSVEQLVFHETLFLPTTGAVEVRTRLRVDTAGIEILSRGEDGTERLHVSAHLGEPGSEASDAGHGLVSALGVAGPPVAELGTDDIYDVYARAGLDYGPAYRLMQSATRYRPDLAAGVLRVPGRAGAIEHLPPPVMDAATHVLAALLTPGDRFVAIRAERFRLFKKPKAAQLRSGLHMVAPDRPDAEFCADIVLLEDGRPVFELTGLAFAQVPSALADNPDIADRMPILDQAALRSRAPRDRLAELSRLIRATVADMLHIDDVDTIGTRTKFVQLGLNSLGAVELKLRLERLLGIELPRSVALDRPSPELLAEYVDGFLGGDDTQPAAAGITSAAS